ncbi:hypothetical protein ACLKA7_007582 [Drosophila subpalustris]
MARQLSECLDAACDSSMPRRKPSRRGSPCYWWNDQIAQLRKACLRARRCSQRARRRPDFEDRLEDLRAAKRALKRAIKAKDNWSLTSQLIIGIQRDLRRCERERRERSDA